MADIREALAETIRGALLSNAGHRFPPEQVVADAILAKFDVTERREGGQPGECTARHPGTRLQCVLKSGHRGVHTFAIAAHPPITLPSVEDVARACGDPGSATPRREGESVPRWSARAALALLPGRTEAEVKAETWDEVADYHDRTNAPDIAESTRRDNPYRQEATRG